MVIDSNLQIYGNIAAKVFLFARTKANDVHIKLFEIQLNRNIKEHKYAYC